LNPFPNNIVLQTFAVHRRSEHKMPKETLPIFTPFQPTLTEQGQSLFGIKVRLKKPSNHLSSYIHAFVHVETHHRTVYPVIPDGTNVLFFSPCKESFGGTQQTILEVPLTHESTEYFGIWFYPGSIRSFFNVDLSTVKNDITSLDFLESPHWLYINEQLSECRSFDQRVELCERLLTKSFPEAASEQRFHHALTLLYRNNGQFPIRALADKIGCSQRHLNRFFQLNTGLSVKGFSQIIRMNEFLKRCYHSHQHYLAHGLDLGFYDQSHLLKNIEKQGLRKLSLKAKSIMSSFYNR
jgi:AraC-like DNA-binding protein